MERGALDLLIAIGWGIIVGLIAWGSTDEAYPIVMPGILAMLIMYRRQGG